MEVKGRREGGWRGEVGRIGGPTGCLAIWPEGSVQVGGGVE